MDFYRPTSIQIRLDRLMENYSRLMGLNPAQSFVCPMIKANAYGHGDVEVMRALLKQGCQFFGVSSVEEGVTLRDCFPEAKILVFGFSGKAAVEELLKRNLTPVVSDFGQLEEINTQTSQKLSLHLKLDTGMHRLGFQKNEIPKLVEVLTSHSNIRLEGVGTHFHTGEGLCSSGSEAEKQKLLFESFLPFFQNWSPYLHAYNSAAIAAIYHHDKDYDFGLRPGLLVYGIDPSEKLSVKPLVSPVMEFRSKIVSTQQVKSGDVVSYDGIWRAKQDSLIGVVPAGYADGVCRSLSNVGEFLVRGQRVPVCGKVCMDYTMVDLTSLGLNSDALIGEDVVLIGQQGEELISVEEMAQRAQRSTYEVVTGISERVPRVYGVPSA